MEIEVDVCTMYDEQWDVCYQRQRLTLSGTAEEIANQVLDLLTSGKAEAVELGAREGAVVVLASWDYFHEKWEIEFRWFVESEDIPDYWERYYYDEARQYLIKLLKAKKRKV